VRYRRASSSSHVEKTGAPGSECGKKSPDNTPQPGQVFGLIRVMIDLAFQHSLASASYRSSFCFLICSCSQQVSHSHQIEARDRQHHLESDAGYPAKLRLAHRSDRLAPAEHLLDALADDLTQSIARMPGGPPVDGRAPTTGQILCHVRGDAKFATQRLPARTCDCAWRSAWCALRLGRNP